MKRPQSIAFFATLLALALPGCTGPTLQKEDMLAEAGFSFRPADTPRKVAALKAFPAHKFVATQRNGTNVWIYADPTICGCLYIGNDAAYGRYRAQVLQKETDDVRTREALEAQGNVMTEQLDWGAWGPWAPFM